MACFSKNLSSLLSREAIPFHRVAVAGKYRSFHVESGHRSVLESRRPQGIDYARVAVLFQAVDAPIIHGVRKPVKPGGNFLSQLDHLSRQILNHSTRVPGFRCGHCLHFTGEM
jgi:hypothetical protein